MEFRKGDETKIVFICNYQVANVGVNGMVKFVIGTRRQRSGNTKNQNNAIVMCCWIFN